MAEESMLAALARPFPRSLIAHTPKTAKRPSFEYVSHGHVVEKLLAQHGPFGFEVKHLVRDGQGLIVGCLATMTLHIDGREVVITEAGETDNGSIKDAASDALKRCAMRAGVGLHLWCHGNYRLAKQLSSAAAAPLPEDYEDPEFGLTAAEMEDQT